MATDPYEITLAEMWDATQLAHTSRLSRSCWAFRAQLHEVENALDEVDAAPSTAAVRRLNNAWAGSLTAYRRWLAQLRDDQRWPA